MKWKSIVELIAIVITAIIVFHFATKTKVFNISGQKGDAPTGVPQVPAADPTVAVNYLNYNMTYGRNDIIAPGGASGNVDVLSSQSALEDVVADQSYGAWSNYVSAVG